MERFMAMRHFRPDSVLDSEKVETTVMNRSNSRDRLHVHYG